MSYSYDRSKTAADKKTPAEYVDALQANTEAFMSNRYDYDVFSKKNGEIWREVTSHGKAFFKEVSDLLRDALKKH